MKVAIIGGGVTGLSAAYDLTNAGYQVTIYEASPDVGGLAAGFKEETWNWSLEKFYHHWFYTDQHILDLIREIGCADKIRFYSPITSVWHEGRNLPMDKPFLNSGLLGRVFNVLSLSPIPFPARLRFGLVGFLLQKLPDGTKLEKHTANDWSRRWIGQAAHDLIWRPLLIGKFGPLYDQVNMAWLWARLYKRTAQLGTYVGGFQAFLDDFAQQVTSRGTELRLGTPVRQIVPIDGGGFIITLDDERVEVDQVLSTTSPGLLALLAPNLPDDYKKQLEALKGMGALALILALDRQLMTDGTYWLNLPASSPDKSKTPFPFLALVEHTNYVSKEHFGGDHLVYLGDYLPIEHEHFHLSEDELATRFLPSLKKINPEFSPAWIRKRWLFRSPYAQPVPLVNQSQIIPGIRTPLKGLYLACMSQVYPWDRGTNYAVEIGRKAARMIVEDAASHTL